MMNSRVVLCSCPTGGRGTLIEQSWKYGRTGRVSPLRTSLVVLVVVVVIVMMMIIMDYYDDDGGQDDLGP